MFVKNFKMLNQLDLLKYKTVGIAGCGGLGSNCAVALARVGIGKLIIADFDVIVESNLNRQYFFRSQLGQKKAIALKKNIELINPSVNVLAFDLKLDSTNIVDVYSECDIIIEAFDLAEMKKMIIETILEFMPQKPLITGVGLAGWGKTNNLKVRKIENIYICGDENSEVSEELPPLAPRVCIVANMQANVALEVLLGDDSKK